MMANATSKAIATAVRGILGLGCMGVLSKFTTVRGAVLRGLKLTAACADKGDAQEYPRNLHLSAVHLWPELRTSRRALRLADDSEPSIQQSILDCLGQVRLGDLVG